MGRSAEGIGLRVPGLIDILGEELLVPAQGDAIHLNTRVNLHGHQLGAILGGKLEPHVE